MSLRRILVVLVSAVAVLLLAVVLYLSFGDLSRHKPRIESFITERTGRPFAIDGAFELEVLPAVSVVAENVYLGNAEWGSDPLMVSVGRFAVEVDLWSLVSGPVEIRQIELSDVAVVLEKNAEGTGNWVLSEGVEADEEPEPADSGATEIPVVIENGRLDHVRVTYREPGKADRVAALDALSIGPGTGDLLAISGNGSLNQYPMTLSGEVGPVESLISGSDIRMALDASVGNLRLDLKGGLGRLDPLQGADLTLKIENPDVGTMLENLELPVVATGSLAADATLKTAGDRTAVDVASTMGDIQAKVTGSLQSLGLNGSDLEFEASVADLARLAAVFGVEGLPSQELAVRGRVATSPEAMQLDGVAAKLAGAEARVDGTVPRKKVGSAKLEFDASVASLKTIKDGLPEIPVRGEGVFVGSPGKFEFQGLELLLGESRVSGTASMTRTGRKRFDVALNSDHLDLTPFAKGESEAAASAPPPDKAGGKDSSSKGKFVFSEEPLPLEKLKDLDAVVQATFAELVLKAATLRDVNGALKIEAGRLSLEAQAKDRYQGALSSSVQLEPVQNGADLVVQTSLRDLHGGLLTLEGSDPLKGPSTNLDVDIRASGASAHQMASGANGRIVLTQGNGTVKSGVINLLGSGILTQLAGQLNPFSAEDKQTTLECMVAQVKIVGGQATVDPVLMQSDKVTVTASGTIDLGTEKLAFDFNTRPRKGIGISAGMFTNPFIQLSGTLASPRLAAGAKGAVAGAVAVGTGGLSVVAKGFVDRVAGEKDLCKAALAEVSGDTPPPKEADAPATKAD